MTILESRLKTGTLTIDGKPFASQASNVRLTPKTDEQGDPLEVLSGDTVSAEDETSWALNITAVQDFDDPTGFVALCIADAGEVVAYSWKPNAGVDTPTYTGNVRIRPVEIGGDVNKRLFTSAEFPCQEKPTVTYPA